MYFYIRSVGARTLAHLYSFFFMIIVRCRNPAALCGALLELGEKERHHRNASPIILQLPGKTHAKTHGLCCPNLWAEPFDEPDARGPSRLGLGLYSPLQFVSQEI